MIATIHRAAAVCTAFALLLAGCAGTKTPPKQYPLRGEITGLDPGGHVATIKHEEIKGFMGAMTMGYAVKDQAEFAKLAVGEPITATVYVTPDEMWVGNIQKDSGATKQP
jgi:protein SCO1